jgi:hypothetical protein
MATETMFRRDRKPLDQGCIAVNSGGEQTPMGCEYGESRAVAAGGDLQRLAINLSGAEPLGAAYYRVVAA